MKNRISKHSGRTNDLLASLVLHPGLIGAASQWVVHTLAFATRGQRGQRTWAGIRRAITH
jgi:hypothetical protein